MGINLKDNVIGFLKGLLKTLLVLGMLFAFFIFFRWVTYRGMISFVLGMLVMASLILTKNPLLRVVIDKTKSDEFIEEIKK